MHRLRNRLIAAFLVATVLPLTATLWITASLLDRSLSYSTTEELGRLSRSMENTIRQFYVRERDALRQEALAGRLPSKTYRVANEAEWPDPVRAFWDSGEAERFSLSGPGGNHVDYMRRHDGGIDVFGRSLGNIRMQELSEQFQNTRALVGSIEGRDLRRGFTLALLLLVAVVWIVSLAPLIFIAHRISHPIQELTAGLTGYAAGDWDRRLGTNSQDEVGRAIAAFNHMADQLRQSRERLVYLTQMSSWQSLARKTAHELKNSLTPIRLTVEEMVARQPPGETAFMETAAQIVVSEIDVLERRVRAFSDFASEPTVNPESLDVNSLVSERVSLLKRGHTQVSYRLALDERTPRAYAAADLVKGILTNLLENAADAAGPEGAILIITRKHDSEVAIEVHDSGPGVSEAARSSLFEPTITFKKHGMGLGLSIAKKNALLSGGDIMLVDGKLGGAGFRVTLPLE